MAKKQKNMFECSGCGHLESKWLGRCPSCGSWNTLLETIEKQTKRKADKKPPKAPSSLAAIGSGGEPHRIPAGMEELDRVLGGGIVPGSSILIGGEPGIGKSTLMLQLAGANKKNTTVVYVAGEESPHQVSRRAGRLGITNLDSIMVQSSSILEDILTQIRNTRPDVIIIDSVQTLTSNEIGPSPGTVSQIKYCCYELISECKEKDIPLFLVAHVTKEGTIAGPKVLEHMVDTVLYFEQSTTNLRIIRAMKNRFGSVDEIGLFKMEDTGLNQIADPSGIFLQKRSGSLPAGIAVAPLFEGSRVILVEIQALTVPAKSGISRVFSDCIDSRRISRLAAVLEKHLGLVFSDQDIYINIAGGIKLRETACELATAMALYSARAGIPMPGKTAAAGELSLAGEVRTITHVKRRLKAAAEMGFTRCLLPEETPATETAGEVETLQAGRVQDCVQLIFTHHREGQ